jgi:hypothetical protein
VTFLGVSLTAVGLGTLVRGAVDESCDRRWTLSLEQFGLVRLKAQPFAVLGRGDGNHGAGALGQRSSFEFGDAVLGHDLVHDIYAGRDRRER